MALRIDPDHRRFRDIVRGKIKQDLRKYISQGELIGRKGKDMVSIPLPQIDIAALPVRQQGPGRRRAGPGRRGRQPRQGRSQRRRAGQGRRSGRASTRWRSSCRWRSWPRSWARSCSCPRIEPKGKQRIIAQKDKYVGIRRAGPESLRHFKRTFRQALRRQIMTGTYDPERPIIVPVREDRRYRSWKTRRCRSRTP